MLPCSADIANQDKMAGVVAQVEALGRKAVAVTCDVRQRPSMEAAVEEAAAKLGAGPDILVASAGGWGLGSELSGRVQKTLPCPEAHLLRAPSRLQQPAVCVPAWWYPRPGSLPNWPQASWASSTSRNTCPTGAAAAAAAVPAAAE